MININNLSNRKNSLELIKSVIYASIIVIISLICLLFIVFSIYLLTPINTNNIVNDVPNNTATDSKTKLAQTAFVKPVITTEYDSSTKLYYIDIKPNNTAGQIISALAQQGIISYPLLFKIILYIARLDSNIHAGEYEISQSMRIHDLIYKIVSGDIKQHSFIIHPGESSVNVLTRLKNNKRLNLLVLDKLIDINYVDTLSNENLIDKILYTKNRVKNLEGVFFPDTYFYTKGSSEIELLNKAVEKLNSHLVKLWSKRQVNHKTEIIKTPYQALVIASILEKEASHSKERSIISGIIYNRLNANMYLQLDPTVIYAVYVSLGKKYSDFTGNLTKKDLALTSPYNTYTTKLLPPTPIGAVSLDSLIAAINPELNDLYYFVAKGDGTHFFSRTLDEHNKAVEKYQKNKINMLKLTETNNASN